MATNSDQRIWSDYVSRRSFLRELDMKKPISCSAQLVFCCGLAMRLPFLFLFASTTAVYTPFSIRLDANIARYSWPLDVTWDSHGLISRIIWMVEQSRCRIVSLIYSKPNMLMIANRHRNTAMGNYQSINGFGNIISAIHNTISSLRIWCIHVMNEEMLPLRSNLSHQVNESDGLFCRLHSEDIASHD